MKAKNVHKLPFIANKTRANKVKANNILKKALDDNLEYVVILGIQKGENGQLLIRSNCGKISQSMAMLDLAKLNYMDQFSSKQIVTGKFDKK